MKKLTLVIGLVMMNALFAGSLLPNKGEKAPKFKAETVRNK